MALSGDMGDMAVGAGEGLTAVGPEGAGGADPPDR